MADDICIVRSMVTEQINHDPAHTFMNTGTAISGRPSMGSWVNYGLGSETRGPARLRRADQRRRAQSAADRLAPVVGRVPARAAFRASSSTPAGDPVHYVSNPAGRLATHQQRELVDTIEQLESAPQRSTSTIRRSTRGSRPTRWRFACRPRCPELMDVSDEPQHVLDMYGAKPGDGSFASNCLLARRLAERGVRFIQLYHRGWDHHGGSGRST